MKQFNERPSKYKNLGEDIKGAMRHNFDTYENPEKKAEKERAKKSKAAINEAKKRAIGAITPDNYLNPIQDFEFTKALESFPGYLGSTNHETGLGELRQFIINSKQTVSSELYNSMASRFNRLSNLLRRNRWRIRSFEQAQKYFESKKKNTFTEENGIKRPWLLTEPFNQSSIEHLASVTKGVQFGNSLPENEREYCLHNLSRSLKTLETYFSFDFKTIAFSFGARGKAGSVAHYEDTNKVLAFNRGWDGTFIHELGHAIDYSLGLASRDIPKSIRDKYCEKIYSLDLDWTRKRYYTNNKELFARLFEQYIRATIPECTDWMQFTFNSEVMPDLDSEAIEYMPRVLKPITKEF
jgi:hypothetical protein